MREAFLSLTPADRIEALAVAASRGGRPPHILEKDVWVVWALAQLFDSPFAEHLVFKGGTSLSKAYRAIQRFSEDIDVTYDIRAIAPDLVDAASDNPIPPSRSQAKKWTDTIKDRLSTWVSETVLPHLNERVAATGVPAQTRAEADCIYIEYARDVEGYGYVAPRVKIEFGARSTGKPAEAHEIRCDASESLPEVLFPTAQARVMRVERTFWEKATAIHVFCRQGRVADRQARHWYDLAQLDVGGFAQAAITARDIAELVSTHKMWFFAAKDAQGQVIDYEAAVRGELTLIPSGLALEALEADYLQMVRDALFLGDAPSVGSVIERCRAIEARANANIAA